MKIDKDLKLKWERFKRDKRAFTSFIILSTIFIITAPAEILCNVRPILLIVDGKMYIPIIFTYSEIDFGGVRPSEPDYLSKRFQNLLDGKQEGNILQSTEKKNQGSFDIKLNDFEDENLVFSIGVNDFEDNAIEKSASPTVKNALPKIPMKPLDHWILWPPVRYDYKYIPTESNAGNVVLAAPYRTFDEKTNKVIETSWVDGHYLGTDDRGRDVLARLIYGLRISMIFGLSIAVTGTLIGCLLGGTQGFFGGWIDLIGQRLTEIWGSIPRLYILIILI